MSSEDPFSPAKRAELRAEILQQGLVADKFLGTDPDVATFGVNLACAWPFPDSWRELYAKLAAQLTECRRGLYVYPHAFTHITLATFVTFSRHVRPTEKDLRQMEGVVEKIVSAIEPALGAMTIFELQPQAPVLARAAGIMPFQNSDGEVQRLRELVLAAVQQDETLHRELVERGLNIPGIIHSTLMRFVELPADSKAFLADFDAIAETAKFPPLRVEEVFLTSETRPYMRGGQVLKRFMLSKA